MVRKKRAASGNPSLASILYEIEKRTPPATAEKWDNVGLLVGDTRGSVTGAVISIDLTEESLEVAKRLGYSLIVNHHPCIFPKQKGIARVTSSGTTKLIYEAARVGIAVIATHTNFDQCALEVPRAVSSALGFKPVGRLFEGDEAVFTKLVVFVPKTHLERVRTAICEAGAGKIGRYDTCAFSVEGEGTFRGGEGTKPFLGERGKLEQVREMRLETVFPRGLKRQVLQALRSSHPYEEIAYDLYRVEQEPGKVGLVSGLGYGVYGDLPKPVSFAEISKRVRKTFKAGGFLMTEPVPKLIRRIGFVAGKGASFVASAKASGCDLFITGEAGYHVAREAAAMGIGVLEVGHRESEIFFLKTMAGWCKQWGISSKVLNTPVQGIKW